MKKLLFAIFAALVIFSGCEKNNRFTVTLNLENADNHSVYLTKYADKQEVILDSAVFAGTNAVLTAPFDDPQTVYYLKFDLNTKSCSLDGTCGEAFPFFTENQNTTISGDRVAFSTWTVKGCPIMDEWEAYRESLLPMENQMMALFEEGEEASFAGDSDRSDEIMEQVYDMMEEYNNKRYDYYKSHGDSYLTHYMVDEEKRQMEPDVLKEIANGFTTESIYSKRIKEYIEGLE